MQEKLEKTFSCLMDNYNLQIRRIKNTKIEEAFCDFLANKDNQFEGILALQYIANCYHNFNPLYFRLMDKNNCATIFEA